MAKIKSKENKTRVLEKSNVKRPGIHSKKKHSQLKSSKNYKKLYVGQG